MRTLLFPGIVAAALILSGCGEPGTGIDWNVVVRGGIDRNALVSMRAEPADKELSQDTGNTVVAGSDLGFAVTIENTSGSRQRHVQVTLTIKQPLSAPIVQTTTVDRINGGEQKTAVFRDLGQMRLATPMTVKAEIRPLSGETNTANNSADYRVIFAREGRVPKSGAVHGTALVSVNAVPGNRKLSQNTENTVTATTDLGFAVTIEGTGDSQEVQVNVTLTVQQTPSPIVQTRTIDLINPGQQKTTIIFRSLGQVQFATKTHVKVDIQPMPEEKNTANNSARYPVIFSLG